MDNKYDLLMRRGPRWAWEGLDLSLDAFHIHLTEVIEAAEFLGIDYPFLELFTQLDDTLTLVRPKIKPMEPIDKTVGFKAEVSGDSDADTVVEFTPKVGFRSEMESDSSLTGEADVKEEDDKPEIAELRDSLDPTHMIKRWI